MSGMFFLGHSVVTTKIRLAKKKPKIVQMKVRIVTLIIYYINNKIY